jgi:SPX domain protein involved in polyphosphate accumulation
VQKLVTEDKADDEEPDDPERQQPRHVTNNGNSEEDLTDEEDGHDVEDSEDESFDALEDRFHGLEEEVAILVADVHDLALYTKLNITGFMKILKVHYPSFIFCFV